MTPLTSAQQVVVHTRLEVQPTPWSHDLPRLLGHRGDRVRGARPAQRADRDRDVDGPGRTGRPPWPGGLTWAELRDAAGGWTATARTLVVDERVAPDAELRGAGRRDRGRDGRARATSPRGVLARLRRDRSTSPARPRCTATPPTPGRRARGLPGHGARRDRCAARRRGCRPATCRATCTRSREPGAGRDGGRGVARVDRVVGRRAGSASTRPTTSTPGDRHVVVARGRDYADVPPADRDLLRRRHVADGRRGPGHPAALT